MPQNPSNILTTSGQFEPSSPPRSGTRPAPDTPKTALIKHISRSLEEKAQHLQRERNRNDEVMGELRGLKHKLEVREMKEEEMNQKIDELQKQLFESKFVTTNPSQLAAQILPKCHEDLRATMEGLSKNTIAFQKNNLDPKPSANSLEDAHQAHL